MGLGSIISQTLIEHLSLMQLDWHRIFRFAAFGYVFSVSHLSVGKAQKNNLQYDCLGSICSILVLWIGEGFLQYTLETN